MENIRLDAEALAFCQDMIYENGALRALPVPPIPAQPFELLTQEASLPEIEFGMQRAGTLAIADRFEVPARLALSTDSSGGSAAATHPSTETETLDGLNASRAISAAYARAVAEQVEGKGLFCKPFFVRYAWRYADGRHSRPSAPVLMLPSVLPPCLAVLGNEAVADKRVITFSPSSCRYFSLRCRVRDAGAAHGGVVALDYFISVPVSTHDTSVALPRGVMRWSSAAAFVGHWSESGDDYADRTAESVGLGSVKAWHFPPNPSMESELLRSVDFFRIASLPASKVVAGVDFFDLPIRCSTDADSVKACERLDTDIAGLSAFDRSLELVASTRLHHGGRLFAAGTQMRLPAPQSLRSMMAAAGASGDPALAETKVTVWAKRGDQVRHIVKAYDDGPSVSLTQAFPRYVYFPCPGAFRMSVKQGTRQWTLPLIPAADGRGAYWWGGLGATSSAPASTTMPTLPADNGTEGGFDCGCVVAISSQGNERVWESLCHCGDGEPVSISALPGQMMVLTTGGIWQLNSSGGRYAGSRLASTDACLSGCAPCVMPGGIAYATAQGIVLLSGTSSSVIIDPHGAPSLPGLQLLNPAQVPQLSDGASPQHGVLPQLFFDGHCLYYRDGSGRMMAYCASSKATAVPAGSALVVTRAFERPVGKRLAAISVSGQFDASAVSLLLWGSHDGATWALAASSSTPKLRPVCGTPYRWYVAAVSSASLPASLLGLPCVWQ